jgi:hypothetical protein
MIVYYLYGIREIRYLTCMHTYGRDAFCYLPFHINCALLSLYIQQLGGVVQSLYTIPELDVSS